MPMKKNSRAPIASRKPSPDPLKGQPVVYMLRCRDGSLYTGWTNDFMQRLASHQSGTGGKYTRSRLPVEPVYLELAEDRSTALKREAAIKKLTADRKRQLITSDSNQLPHLTPELPLPIPRDSAPG